MTLLLCACLRLLLCENLQYQWQLQRAPTPQPPVCIMGVTGSSLKDKDAVRGINAEGNIVASDDVDLIVTVNAKTKCNRSRTVKTKKVVFKATTAGTSIGNSAEESDIAIDDTYLSTAHIHISINEAGQCVLTPLARTYWLIGQGTKTTGAHKLMKGQVVKMGALSLEVTSTCSKPRPLDLQAEAEAARKAAEDPDGVCYICFENTSEEGNQLVTSQCACSKLVHRECLSQWIATKGSRLCSICKSKLPIEFIVQPPYIVMQVVRHMRGLNWTGEREYVVDFHSRDTPVVTVGSGADCDLHLPDPSLSRCHARIAFDKDIGFVVEDFQSSAGTFLRLSSSRELPIDQELQFKLGRTVLTVKVTAKKKGMLRSWRKRG